MHSSLTETEVSDKQFGKLARAGFIEPTPLTLIARPVCNLVMERRDNEFVSRFRKLPSRVSVLAVNVKPRIQRDYSGPTVSHIFLILCVGIMRAALTYISFTSRVCIT